MIRRPPRSTQSRSSAASDVYKRQPLLAVDEALGPVVPEEQFIELVDHRFVFDVISEIAEDALRESPIVVPAALILVIMDEFCLLYTSDTADDLLCVDLG